MATATDPNRPSTGPLNTQQRQRLEALQFAKRLVKFEPGYQQQARSIDIDDLMRVADYIVCGDMDGSA